MEPMPIGKRTRLQRAIQERALRDRSRRARVEARKKYRREMCLVISDDDEEEAVMVVDEEEYNRRILGCSNSSSSPAVEACFDKRDKGCESGLVPDNATGYNSDESLQVLGERWNPMILGEYDDVYDDSSEDNIDSGVVVTAVPSNGDGGEDDDVGLTSSEDDDSEKDRDFKVGDGGKYSSSEYSSSTDEESEEISSCDGEGYVVGRVVKERKKGVEGEGEQEQEERKKERRRQRKEKRLQKRIIRDGNSNGNGGDDETNCEKNVSKRKKKERVSMKEVFDSLISPLDSRNDAQQGGNSGGEKKINSGSRRSSVKIKKGSDGVFRKVVSSSENEDDNVGGETSFNKSDTSPSEKMQKGSDGVFTKVVSSSGSGDDKLDRNHSVKKKSGDGFGVRKKVVSSSRNGDDNVGEETGSKNADQKHYVKSKKRQGSDGVFRKEDIGKDSSHDDEESKKKVVRKERVDEEGGIGSSEREASAQTVSRQRKRKEKTTERQNTLLETIFKQGNEGVQETIPPTPAPREYVHLPLKFWFPAKKDQRPEKTEEEVEADDLFKEMEFGLQACDIGSDDSTSNDLMEVDPPESAVSGNVLCAGGNHDFIHDEEIGLICRFCSYIIESKYITPDFNADIFGRAGRKDSKKSQSDDKNSDRSQILDLNESGQDAHEQSKITKGTVWELIPGTWRTLYPHQREGFEFIWKNVSGGININELEQPTKYGVGGCIICHAPGTGKTRLAIVFIQSFLKQYPNSKPVIIAPRTMLRTWQEEFVRWKVEVPFFNLNQDELSGKEDGDLLKHMDSYKDKKSIRLVKLASWCKGKGILGISYGLFEKLANERHKTDKKVQEALLNKPELLVLDEGHTPRNEKSNIWKVLREVSTKRKVILSGTPFQNNFDELSNTLSLVREEFGVQIKTGSFVHDERKIEELSNKIRPFVHVHKGEILKETLKGLFSSLIVLNPSQLQDRCFSALVGQNNFSMDNLVSVASVHPSIFCEQKQRPNFINQQLSDLLDSHKEDLDAGVKTRFLFELIKLCQGERVLVFGQYLPPLNFLAGLIKTRFHWEMGRELLYMDGSQDTKERQNTIRLFNDPKSEACVLLASTKACSEGIHLVGASRVVLLDVVWNPSVERQAISRAYRLGQKKDVFVYHLITSGTLEEQKYSRQATKERLSELVFSSAEGKRVQKSITGSRFFVDQVLEAMLDHEKLKTMFHKIVYQPKADNLINSFGPLNL